MTAYYHIGSDLTTFTIGVESLDDADEDSNHIAFGHIDVPDLPPGGEFSISTPTSIVPAAAQHDEARQFILSVCLSRTSWTDPYLDFGEVLSGRLDCNGQQHIRVLPDYEGVCNAPLLAPGGVHVFAEHNCGHVPPVVAIHQPRPVVAIAVSFPCHRH